MRQIKKSINIFLPEDSGGSKCNSTEYHYLSRIYARNMRQEYMIKFFPRDKWNQFLKEMVQTNKTEFSAIILDFDFQVGGGDIQRQVEKIQRLARSINGKNAKIYLSSRAWEVWMCMHNCPYTKPFVSQDVLNKDVASDYEKNQEWYRKNEEDLKSTLNDAVNNARLSRGITMSNSPIQNLVTQLPNYEDSFVLNELANIGTFTYIDFLIEDLNNYCI